MLQQTPGKPVPLLNISADFPEKMKDALFTPKRYKVFYGGRGAGRSWGVARFLLLEGLQRPIRVLCARELQKSIEESVHQVLSDQIKALGLEQFYIVQKHKIIGVGAAAGTEFFFEGIRNNVTAVKSYEGIDYCWVEEANKVTKNSWGHLTPTIRKEGSEIIITFNPELEDDYTYKHFVTQADPRLMTVVHMTFRDNPWFPEVLMGDLLHSKATDEDEYLNVWEGACLQQLEGAVYAKQMRNLRASGRIMEVPYYSGVPVDVYMDLGKRHNTSLWVQQFVAMQHRVLHFHQEKGEDVEYYIKYLQALPYTIGTVYLPHDAKAKRLGMKTTVEEQFRRVFRVQVIPRMGLNDGIEATKVFLNNAYFDEEGTVDGRMALARYKFEVDKDGKWSKNPDENCEEADAAAAARYMSLVAGGKPLRRSKDVLKQSLQDAANAVRGFAAEREAGLEPHGRAGRWNKGSGGSRGGNNPGQGWMS